jgi:hypothetical protein
MDDSNQNDNRCLLTRLKDEKRAIEIETVRTRGVDGLSEAETCVCGRGYA